MVYRAKKRILEKGKRKTTDMPKKLLDELVLQKQQPIVETKGKNKNPKNKKGIEEPVEKDERNFNKRFVNNSLKRKQLRKEKRKGGKKKLQQTNISKNKKFKGNIKDDIIDAESEEEEEEEEESSEEEIEVKRVNENMKKLSKAEEEEEKYMRALEKKLKIKKKDNILKNSAFIEDGFDDLLNGLDLKWGSSKLVGDTVTNSNSESDGEKLEFENSYYYSTRAPKVEAKEEGSETDEDINGDDEDIDEDDEDEDDEDKDDLDEEDLDDEEEEEEVKPEVKEIKTEVTKYIPPHLRNKDDKLEKLQRIMRGLINKLSENNIESILFEIEALYQTNSRNSVTSTITDIILDLISDKATLLDTFVILHSTIIASLYQLVGVELAAHFTQTLIEKFIKHYENGLKLIKDNDSNEIDTDEHSDVKISLNLITLISELYNLEVISCVLIYDLIKMFLKRLNSVNVELLLKIIRAIGSTLRNDDPTAMKDIILIAQKEMQKETKISSRMKFMMEVLTNIKNNKVKKNLLNQQNITNEEFIKKMKLFLKNIKKKKYVGHTEPLRVSLEDIKQTSVKGKWWLVGSAWKDNMYGEENQMTKKENEMDNDIIKENQASLLNLAREQGMNTDLRKQIFTTIMGSEDYIDAYEKLLKLNLSEKQMRDIPRVLLNCCGNEKIYNPYYTLLCIKFNMYKTSFKITFQYALWDLFRELGESNIGGFDTKIQNESKNVPVRKILNLGKLYGEMMGKNSVYLTVLKTLNFTTLKSRTRLLLQIILCNMLLVSNDEDLAVQISKIKELKELLNGIRFFLFNFIMKSNSIQSLPFNDQEKEKILIMAKFLDQLLVI